MQRYIDPNQTTLFRGAERIRLMTMIVMLGVLGMMIFRARDPHTWRWLAAEETVSPATLDAQAKERAETRRRAAEKARMRQLAMATPAPDPAARLADDVPPPTVAAAAGNATNAPAATPPPAPPSANGLADDVPPPDKATHGLADDVPPPDPAFDATYAMPSSGSPDAANSPGENPSSVAGPPQAEAAAEEPPIDEDPIERKEFDFEVGAITDKESLGASDMPAYWRLIDWERQQTFKQLDKRGRRDLVFTHLWEHPERYRGQLVRLKLQLHRAIATDATSEAKARDLPRIYEAWGNTDESHNPYAVVLTSLPANFPLGYNINEDVIFDGYFLKLMRFQAGDQKLHAAPLLIGQILWHERTMPVMEVNPTYVGMGVLGAMAVLMLIVRLTFQFRPLRRRSVLPPLRDNEEAVPIETWLERVETLAAPDSATAEHGANGHVEGNGLANGAAQLHPDLPLRDSNQGEEG